MELATFLVGLVWFNRASIPNFTFLGSLEVPHYYYPLGVGGCVGRWVVRWVSGWVGVEIIRIKAVLSSAGLAYWTGAEPAN